MHCCHYCEWTLLWHGISEIKSCRPVLMQYSMLLLTVSSAYEQERKPQSSSHWCYSLVLFILSKFQTIFNNVLSLLHVQDFNHEKNLFVWHKMPPTHNLLQAGTSVFRYAEGFGSSEATIFSPCCTRWLELLDAPCLICL